MAGHGGHKMTSDNIIPLSTLAVWPGNSPVIYSSKPDLSKLSKLVISNMKIRDYPL
jgi:hypothetical protein